MNIYAEIRREVGAYNGVAVADGGAELTYQGLFRLVDATAARLRAFGIGRDFRVGVEVENSAGYIALSLAILSLDAVIVPVSGKGGQQPQGRADEGNDTVIVLCGQIECLFFHNGRLLKQHWTGREFPASPV